TVRDSVGGGLLGALPLRRIGTGWRRCPFRIAGPVAGWHLPTTDPLMAPGQETTVLPALTTALTDTMPWERLDLRFLPAGGALALALPCVHTPSGTSRRLPLADGQQYTGSGATRMRQYARRLERRGHAELLPAVPSKAVAEVVVRFAELHTARWAD